MNSDPTELPALCEPLDAILRQIIGGYFVLTDGQGSVSKWSEPAELLFAQPSEEIGRPDGAAYRLSLSICSRRTVEFSTLSTSIAASGSLS